MKHRIVHTLQKYFLNPPIKLALAIGLPLPGYALLETKGRKTGKPRRTPVGDGRVGEQFWLVAEHGLWIRISLLSQAGGDFHEALCRVEASLSEVNRPRSGGLVALSCGIPGPY